MKFAVVILPQALPLNYTYFIPEELEDKVRPGHRVAVQFGRHKKYAAIVKEVHETPPKAYEVKPLLHLLDKEPLLYPAQLEFWEWLAAYYMCTEGEVMNAALPSYFKITSETRILLNPEITDELDELSDEEYLVAEALQLHKELTTEEIQQILGKATVYPVINEMLQKGLCLIHEKLQEAYKPKKDVFVELTEEYQEEEQLKAAFELVKNAPKQEQALLALMQLRHGQKAVKKKLLETKSGASSSSIKALADKGIIRLIKREIERLPLQTFEKEELTHFTLNEEQQNAYDKIHQIFEHKQRVLLKGVTSSGKTMIYIRFIQHFLKQGKQVLYLLPEIALTAQIIRRLQAHFGTQIGIYHSKFNGNERIEIWNKVKDGDYKIILGARSALFLPYKNLGLIVLDEEHDSSYKQQDPAPRYHARDAAIYYAQITGAKILMGSATPSIETYFNATQGKYGFVELKERYGHVQLPEIEVVDMKKVVFPKGGIHYLSPLLEKEINHSIKNKQQVILFQNRRGFAPAIMCSSCGWIPKCKNCDVSLTYHKHHHRLHCHYCGQQYPVPEACPACGSTKIRNRSFGTERVEDELSGHFPQIRVKRMDYDTVKNKNAHQRIIRQFEDHKIDILVGTQIVVKGLDFDRVNLVGILNADTLLNYPDFRLNERAFQLLEQVSGRSGRRGETGKVVLQTINTQHPIIHFVIQHDYEGFYKKELQERENYGYPPYTRLIKITLRHRTSSKVQEAARVLHELLKPHFGEKLLGPAVPLISRIRNYYLMEFIIKVPRTQSNLMAIKIFLRKQFNHLKGMKGLRQVRITPDVDSI